MLTYWETLIARKSNITVSDSYAKLWEKKSQSGYTVETYTGTLPATLQTVEGYLESYKIYGNTVQDGTPTPENPIVPSGCGEKTGNLFDKDATLDGYWLSSTTGKAVSQAGYSVSDYIRASDGESYTLVEAGKTFCWYDENKGFISTTISTTASAPTGAAYFRVNLYTANKKIAMVIEGSTAPSSYTPYGYKLPILSNSTVTNIYLGEAATTRRIKKYVFTGEENGTLYSTGTSRKGIEITGIPGIIGGNANIAILAICTHYRSNTRSVLYRNTDNGISNAFQNDNIIFYDANYQTVEAFQQFCAQQYAAGTPVTVWYILAEPETGIVNEPLMKIGDYADTVSMEQAGVSIPTAPGSTTISWAGEGLAPSEVELVYKVKG